MKKALASPLGATLVRKVDERFLRAAKGAFPLGERLPTPVNAKIRGGKCAYDCAHDCANCDVERMERAGGAYA